MFHYDLPNGVSNIKVKLNAAGKVIFGTPPLHQAHTTAINILDDPRWSAHFKKIIDFGCGDMRLFKLIRRMDAVEHILNVDMHEPTLLSNKSRIEPLVSDHLQERKFPLRAEVLKGNIIDAVENVRNADAVVVLDVIQQLEPEELEKVSDNIFGFIQPKLVLVSTPNREFNVLLNDLKGNGFRSLDHKFEWTREEYRKWANKISIKHSNYSFSILGVAPAPPSRAKVGAAIQMAIFVRNDIIDRDLANPVKTDLKADERPEVQYKQIYAVDFPFFIDKRTKEEKIEAEIMHYLGYAHKAERYYNRERCIYQIPTAPLMEYASNIEANDEDVLKVLKALNFDVQNEFILLTQDYIDEQFNYRYDDTYEELDDDFLEFEPYRGGLDDDDAADLEQRLSTACSITDEQIDEEEKWD